MHRPPPWRGSPGQTTRVVQPVRQTDTRQYEDYEEFDGDPDRNGYGGDEDEDEDDAVSSKLEKAITIGGILIGAVIVVILGNCHWKYGGTV